MKPMPYPMQVVLGSNQFIPAVFLYLNLGVEEFLYTTWGTSLELGGRIYQPRAFSIENLPATTGNVSNSVTISVEDVDKLMLGSIFEVDTAKSTGSITYAALNDDYIAAASLVMFDGVLSHWGYSPGKVTLTLSDLFVQWARVSLLTISTSCRWPLFKGTECQYAGIEGDCNRSYSTCEGYGNKANFGGFRWLASMVNKKIEV